MTRTLAGRPLYPVARQLRKRPQKGGLSIPDLE
jgi:hypothetical protein